MTTLAANLKRTYEFNIDPLLNDLDVIAADIIFEGAAVGESSSTGTFRPLQDGDVFAGFAVAKCDNTGGAASAKTIRVRQRGVVKLPVGGTLSLADVGATVYATDDNTFSKTDSGSDTAIGKIVRFLTTTTAMVAFEATAVRSL